jgi:hypothetical protein
MSYGGTIEGLLVTVEIEGAHPRHPTYSLLPGDLILQRPDGTFGKFSGLGIEGFRLTPEQRATLRPSGEMRFRMGGVADYIAGELSDA